MAGHSAIPTFYENDDTDGIRDHLRELKTWLPSQPQDAWFMVVKNDTSDAIYDFMIDDPQCDIAIIARIFWKCAPSYYVANPDDPYGNGATFRRILARIESGCYRRREFALNRFELIDEVQHYAGAVRDRRTAGQPLPFKLSRALLGPFPGRNPRMVRGNEATERHLDEIAYGLGNSFFYRSNDEWRDAFQGNYGLRHYLTLPKLDTLNLASLDGVDELAHIAALYGTIDGYWKARREYQDAPYAGRASPPSLWGRFRWATRDKRGNEQFYNGV
jgi:hypothetical protein